MTGLDVAPGFTSGDFPADGLPAGRLTVPEGLVAAPDDGFTVVPAGRVTVPAGLATLPEALDAEPEGRLTVVLGFLPVGCCTDVPVERRTVVDGRVAFDEEGLDVVVRAFTDVERVVDVERVTEEDERVVVVAERDTDDEERAAEDLFPPELLVDVWLEVPPLLVCADASNWNAVIASPTSITAIVDLIFLMMKKL